MTPEHKNIVDVWNVMARDSGLAPVRILSPARITKLNTRIAEANLESVFEAVTIVGKSDFCKGKNNRGWKADIDFLLQAKSFTRILEGYYDNRTAPRPTFRNAAIELLARDAEAEGRWPGLSNTQMIAGDD